MKNLESKIDECISNLQLGATLSRAGKSFRRKRGAEYTNLGKAQERAILTEVGRERKKIKTQKKYYKKVTLTEIFGKQWNILAKK